MTVAGRARTHAAGRGPDAEPTSRRGAKRCRRLVVGACRHPLWTVAIAAIFVRVLAVIALGPLRDGVAVPDEAQYLGLAASVAAGHGAEAWQPGYGASLFDRTSAFMAPLTGLTWLFGTHQLNGQILAATFGVLAAVLTALLATRVVRPGFAVLAGLLVAVLPSQVYWSSVVLRESMIWAALVVIAWAIAAVSTARSDRHLVLMGLIGFIALFTLGHLRQQTAVVTAWALVLACLLVPSRRRLYVRSGALLIAVAAPLLAGLGPAGYGLLEHAVPRLAFIRANLSLGASSSIVHRTPIAPSPSATSIGGQGSGGSGSGSGAPSPGASAPPNGAVVTAANGQQFRVDDTGTAGSLSALPSGLLAVTVRPYPWESASNTSVLMAKIENIVWLPLYALALVGVALGRRRRAVLAFPVVVTVAIVLTAALTQGNLGTAFRHRGQVLWAIAILAAVGVQGVFDRRRATPS